MDEFKITTTNPWTNENRLILGDFPANLQPKKTKFWNLREKQDKSFFVCYETHNWSRSDTDLGIIPTTLWPDEIRCSFKQNNYSIFRFFETKKRRKTNFHLEVLEVKFCFSYSFYSDCGFSWIAILWPD